MAEGNNPVADVALVIQTNTAHLEKGLGVAHNLIQQFAGEGSTKLQALDGIIGGLGGSVTAFVAKLNPWVAAATSVWNVMQKIMPAAEEFATKIGADEQFGRFKTAVGELGEAIGGTFSDAMTAGKEKVVALADAGGGSEALKQFLDSVTAKATAAAHALQGVVEGFRPIEKRSDVGLEAQIAALESQIARAKSPPPLPSMGPAVFGAGSVQARNTNALEQQLDLLRASLDARRELGAMNYTLPRTDREPLSVPELEASTEALRKQNAELELRLKTFGLSAEAAQRVRVALADAELQKTLGGEAGGLATDKGLADNEAEKQRALANLRAVEALGEAKRKLDEEDRKERGVEKGLTGLMAENDAARAKIEMLGRSAGAVAEELTLRRLVNGAAEQGVYLDQRMLDSARELAAEKGRLVDLEKAFAEEQQKSKQGERILGGGQREVEQVEARARGLAMSVGEVARLNAEEKLRLQFSQAGIVITDKQDESIRRLAGGVGEVTQRLAEMQEAAAPLKTVASNLEGAFGKFISKGKLDWKDFIRELEIDLAKLAFRMALQPIFGGGSAGGGLLGGLVGSLFGFGGGRASGGPVQAGTAYEWQENGREYFAPTVDGMVFPEAALTRALAEPLAPPAQASGGTVNVRMHLDLTGVNGEETMARIAGQAAQAAFSRAVEETNAAFPARQRQFNLLGT